MSDWDMPIEQDIPTISIDSTTSVQNVTADLESIPTVSKAPTTIWQSFQSSPTWVKAGLGVLVFAVVATAVVVPVVLLSDAQKSIITITSTSTTSATPTTATTTTSMSTTSATTTTATTTTSATTTSATTTTATTTTSATTTSATTTTATTTTSATTTSATTTTATTTAGVSTTSATTTTTTSATTTTATTTTTTTQTTSTTTTATTTTSESTTTTTSETTTTTSASCPTGYVRTPSGSCVNLLIDFNNCGSIGYVCGSSYTSCSNGACSGAPAVLLVGGVSVSGWGGNYNTDDAFMSISTPFNVTLYGTTTDAPSVQSNGCVCLGGCSIAWSNGYLPDNNFADATAFGYFDDLYMVAGTSQTVYYGVVGTYPNRNLVYEFYTSHYGAPNQYYHFQIVFYEASPGIVTYDYFQADDGGASATIGVQSSSSGPSMTYSVNQAVVPVGTAGTSTPTLSLTFDTNAGNYTSSG